MSKNPIIIYWAIEDTVSRGEENDWNIFAPELESLYKEKYNNLSNNPKRTFFRCPAVKNVLNQTFVIKNPIDCSYSYTNDKFSSNNDRSLNLIINEESMLNNPSVMLAYSFYFFCEEGLDMTLSSPFFSNSPYMKYGSIVPGMFNIGSWFRSVNMEINLWNNNGVLEIKEDEDLAYIRFHTDRKIILKRFIMNERLTKISNVCSGSVNWEPWVPLPKRYKRFKSSRTNKIVAREIKNNIID